MVDEALVLRVERLGISLDELRKDLRRGYAREAQVNSALLRREAARLAEEWMVQIVPNAGVKLALGATIGDLNIQFTRLLTYSERRSLRRRYDVAIAAILREYNARLVFPLKRARDSREVPPQVVFGRAFGDVQSAFIGHSFAPGDRELVSAIQRTLMAFHIRVESGERPSADRVSEKVKRRIDRCDAFIGIFARRDRLSGRDLYSTSAWIIDEKAYAVARDKKLLLLKDIMVESIGGLQGDYEYLEFEPANLLEVVLRVVELLTEE